MYGWIVAAPLRFVAGLIRDEREARRLQREFEQTRRAIPCSSNSEIDAILKRAA